jgi:SIR2-like domain
VKTLEPPYPFIVDSLQNGRVIPFLGAGASLGCPVSESATTGPSAIESLPSGGELARRLAARTRFPGGKDPALATVAQYFEDVAGGRSALNLDLRQIFDRDYEPSGLHRYLAGIPHPLLIVTTNYDDLIERAFREANRRFDLVVHTTDPRVGQRVYWIEHGATEPQRVSPKTLDLDLENVTVIYKMHGAVDRALATRDQFVITEDDYVDFLTRMTRKTAVPALFAQPFEQKHFLFLGYGLRDWNLRVVLNRVSKGASRAPGLRSWAIDADPSILEMRFWQGRGVEIYKMTIDGFLDGLSSV